MYTRYYTLNFRHFHQAVIFKIPSPIHCVASPPEESASPIFPAAARLSSLAFRYTAFRPAPPRICFRFVCSGFGVAFSSSISWAGSGLAGDADGMGAGARPCRSCSGAGFCCSVSAAFARAVFVGRDAEAGGEGAEAS